MGRRPKQPTQEQLDFRNSILRGRLRTIKKAELPPIVSSHEDEIRRSFYFLNNCVYWINEYIDGRASKDRLLSVSKAIQQHGKNIEQTIKTITNE